MGSRLEKNSQAVRKRIENHTFDNEEGEEYQPSKFGGFSDYFRRKKIKLQNLDAELRSSSGDKPQIFKGVVAHVNGYTQPSLQDLHQMIVSYGGGFMQYLDGKTTVTHIIAASLTPKKAIEFKRYRIVKPAWVVDSISAGKLLPWESYRVLDEGVRQNLIAFDGGKIVSQANTQQRGYRDQTNASWYTSQVRDIAEDIDDDEGALFPSTQPVLPNNETAYSTRPSARSPPSAMTQTVSERAHDLQPGSEPDPSNPESFEVTSSLEDALNAATTGKNVNESQIDDFGVEDDSPKGKPVEDILDAEELTEEVQDTTETAKPRKRSRSISPSPPSKKAKPMTAEEHNELLLADPHIRKSSTANPEFLKQYYSESRLHHLSTWKAELKSKFQQMASERSPSQKQAIKRRPGARRYIMHVDFDSFFCAVSLKVHAPDYIDKPAVVAHGRGTGSEIASCNYPARKFGVKNGMWMQNALSLCSDIKVLPYDFPAYEEASRQFYEAIIAVGGIVQSVSIDEALVDISELCITAGGSDGTGVSEGSIWREQAKANEIAENLRQRIKEATGCAVSIGIGGNILLAKVALRKAKPAGQYQVKPEEVLDFLSELLVQDLPGVAYSIGGKLEEAGVKYVKDIRSLTKDRLMTILGPKTGEKIWDYSRGIDRTEVGEQVIRKSVSAEINWGIRFISQPEAEEFVQNLCGEVQRRLLNEGVKGRQLTMKIMKRAADAPIDPPKHLGHGKCDTYNKSIVLGVATSSAEIIGKEAISILRSYGFSPGELRGLGVQMTRLEPIKASASHPEGSQRRITFNTPATKSKLNREVTDDPIDDHDSPQKPRHTPVHPAAMIAKSNQADESAKKPLNLMGTQFLLPTQVDPAVLAELPMGIRSKLLAQGKSNPPSRAESPAAVKSRSQSPAIQLDQPQLPSQLDPEVFDALPEEMKAEVLATYSHTTTTHVNTTSRTTAAAAAQALLPQSPRKSRTIPPPSKKQLTTPTKKRTLLSRTRGPPKDSSHSTLTQSNFLTSRQGGPSNTTSDTFDTPLDPDFLAALPDDVRQEVIAEHKRARLAKRSGLITSTRGPKRKPPEAALPPGGQRRIRLPPRPAKPTFTTSELSSLPELRETLSEWFTEFREEGPHSEDVRAMERYLRRVVLEEGNMDKAVGVVRWIDWLVGEMEEEEGEMKGKRAWEVALGGIKDVVRGAVRERGIGEVQF